MNYLFQIDLLGPNHDRLDYSGQALRVDQRGFGGQRLGLGADLPDDELVFAGSVRLWR